MRLNDIFLTERSDQANLLISKIQSGEINSLETIRLFVQGINAQQVGKTARSNVYLSMDGPWVLKITTGGIVLDEDDLHYFKFAQYVIANKPYDRNPLFPVIKYVHQFKDRSYCTIVERLSIDPARVKRMFKPLVSFGVMDEESLTTFFTCLLDKQPYTVKGLFNSKVTPYEDCVRFMESISVSPEHLVEYMAVVSRINGELDEDGSDLHLYNIGFRADGQIVFFDP